MIIEAVNGYRPQSDIQLRLVQDEDTVKVCAQTDPTDDDPGWLVFTFHENSEGLLAVEVANGIDDDEIATDNDGHIKTELE